MDISKVEERALVPLGGALVPQKELRYRIDLVATEAYGSRPYKSFTADQVKVCTETGTLQFRIRAIEVQRFIWNLIFKRAGKGNPAGEFVNVYVFAYRRSMKIARATLTGNIIVCNNVGPELGFVIEVQANSGIEVEHYG